MNILIHNVFVVMFWIHGIQMLYLCHAMSVATVKPGVSSVIPFNCTQDEYSIEEDRMFLY